MAKHWRDALTKINLGNSEIDDVVLFRTINNASCSSKDEKKQAAGKIGVNKKVQKVCERSKILFREIYVRNKYFSFV